jgi:hypothetical protein
MYAFMYTACTVVVVMIIFIVINIFVVVVVIVDDLPGRCACMQYLTASLDSTRKQSDLQNTIHANRQFLEELKLEYESFAETSRLEFEAYKKSQSHDHQRELHFNTIINTFHQLPKDKR